jgi:putative pyruvate formate lyase activating enzyme
MPPRTLHTADRLKDELGVCKVGRKALVSTVAPHFAEEAPLQGWRGSGTVFFSGCNLRCVFCQNWDISQQRAGWWLPACLACCLAG